MLLGVAGAFAEDPCPGFLLAERFSSSLTSGVSWWRSCRGGQLSYLPACRRAWKPAARFGAFRSAVLRTF